MPNYIKFVKDILSKKRWLGKYEIVALTEECSVILQKKATFVIKGSRYF